MAGPRPSAERIRVLQFADVVNRHDFIDVIIRHADPSRFALSVCTLGRPSNIADPEFDAAGIRNWNLRAPSRRHYGRAVVGLAALLRREKIDLIHAHHYEPGVIAAAATLLHPRTRLVVGRHYSDAIYLNTTRGKRRAMLAIEAATNRRGRRIIAPSSMIADLLRRQGVNDDKIDVIPYAFEDEKFDLPPGAVEAVRQELRLEDRRVIGTFARLYRDKGHRFLLDAMPEIVRSVPDVLLLLVGEGADRRSLEEQVQKLGLGEHVRFLGWRRDSLAVMSAVAVVVQPTLQEAFSQAMVEALWLGKPLVIGDVSGARDVIHNGENGVIVPPRDSGAIRDQILLLLCDQDLRTAMSTRASEIRTELSVSRVVPRYERALAEALK